MYKLYIFSPKDEKIIRSIVDAASGAGAGIIGNYTHCSFVTEGYGTWYSLPGAKPTIGKVGELSKENEVRIEMECPKGKIQRVVEAVKKVHPFDKFTIDAVEITRFE